MRRVNLISGGVDSTVMAKEYPGINLYVDFGQSYAREEKAALCRMNIDFECVELSKRYKTESDEIYIPNRNLTMASIAATLYNPDEILMAGLADDNCIDKTPEAFKKMSAVISEFCGKPVLVRSPYFNKSKGQIIEDFIDKEVLKKTFSCYNPGPNGTPCGNCPACLRRTIALETNGIDSGVQLTDRIIKEYLKKIHKYSPDRISRFFIYLKNRYNVIAVDIDGILTVERKGSSYAERTANRKNIERINALQGIKVLYSARMESDRQITENWLKENKVQYDALMLNKLPYSVIYDDLAEVC